ncbi:FHA domain-containing protein [Actinokineospora globicatena]|uniref:FHA domain-containing protein n=1 Tax=Actinokineospora globicatena TaxID=103729 RepID=A0A9W6V7B3_9PSEU|nr:FHA domain-containing protein [Actinokineospora globicatena]MCP2302884.1 FHA domain-containing protein [Actinokineospora globicatena]GLW78733.1 hypothetical protein Aglo01_32150 [Actinokineospora globicatena]GLW84599.1 hypothetical protein Aglo02_22390 [Actinokineospora globicatena]GLW91202.1 hypothetical protein Aglo03_20180 [Actinokineospora globicatena]
MSRVCSKDRSEVYDDSMSLCPQHLAPLVTAVDLPPVPPPEPAPAPGRAEAEQSSRRQSWSRAVCWHCGTGAAEGNTRCTNLGCGRSLTPPALLVVFDSGEVMLEVGQKTQLGRHGEHERVFATHANVSRAHAVLRVDGDGTAWVTPLRAVNGTFLNDVELTVELERQVASGDRIRLGRDAKGTITLFEH